MQIRTIILSFILAVGLMSEVHASSVDFETQHFSGSGKCASCHNDLKTTSNEDISIITNWSTSMMANATRDPYWRAKVSSELKRNPGVAAEINDKCSVCHAPMANVEMKKANKAPVIFGDNGFFHNGNDDYTDAALDGVSCSACHQIEDKDLGTLAGFSGHFTIPDFKAGEKDKRPAYGQYGKELKDGIIPYSGMGYGVHLTPTYGSHMQKSEVCATCHNVKTPFVDAKGKVVSTTPESEFPEQMPYTEWLHSDFNIGKPKEKNCQACHMPKVKEKVEIAGYSGIKRPDFARHTFLGANTIMLDIFKSNRSNLKITDTATDNGFEKSIKGTRKLLESAATVDIISTKIIGDKLKVILKVNNKAGHKLPSSYPSRRAFIHFMITDENKDTVFESGKLNGNGSIVGDNGDEDSTTYEPHYDQITQRDQVQVYESMMKNTDGEVTHTLMRAAGYVKDNRLLPAGFDKNTAESDIAVIGAAMKDDNFTQGSDTVTYLVDISNQKKFTILAELKYQTIAFGHIQDMFKDADIKEVSDFREYLAVANDNKAFRSETLATKTIQVDSASIKVEPKKVEPKKVEPKKHSHHSMFGGALSIWILLACSLLVLFRNRFFSLNNQ